MYNPNIRQRFGLYLEVFLKKIGSRIRKVFKDETWLVSELLEISDIPKSKISKDDVKEKYRNALLGLNENLSGKEISLPISFKMRITGLRADDCKIMKSKKKPLWLRFESKNSPYSDETILVIFKKGDDLRQDILTLQLFRVMFNIWYNSGLCLKMNNYTVVSTGYFQGFVEVVTDSETLATIHKQGGGATAALTSKPLKSWLDKNIKVSKDECIQNFLLSNVAYCIATFTLGVGDRHNDNLMIKRVIL